MQKWLGLLDDKQYQNTLSQIDYMYSSNWYTEYYFLGRLHAGIQYMFRCRLVYKFDVSYAAGSYIDRDSNQFPHYRPWVVLQTIGLRF